MKNDDVMNIFLIGYRCSGKTITGQTIAGILDRPFIDTDFKVVEEQGMTISQIVDQKGWDYFRQKETAVLKKVCNHGRQIVATGGGIVLSKENTAYMKKNGTIVWLKATFETIKERMLIDSKTKDFRPSLTTKKLETEITETLLLRNPYYEKAMDFSIDTDDLDIKRQFFPGQGVVQVDGHLGIVDSDDKGGKLLPVGAGHSNGLPHLRFQLGRQLRPLKCKRSFLIPVTVCIFRVEGEDLCLIQRHTRHRGLKPRDHPPLTHLEFQRLAPLAGVENITVFKGSGIVYTDE